MKNAIVKAAFELQSSHVFEKRSKSSLIHYPKKIEIVTFKALVPHLNKVKVTVSHSAQTMKQCFHTETNKPKPLPYLSSNFRSLTFLTGIKADLDWKKAHKNIQPQSQNFPRVFFM